MCSTACGCDFHATPGGSTELREVGYVVLYTSHFKDRKSEKKKKKIGIIADIYILFVLNCLKAMDGILPGSVKFTQGLDIWNLLFE